MIDYIYMCVLELCENIATQEQTAASQTTLSNAQYKVHRTPYEIYNG